MKNLRESDCVERQSVIDWDCLIKGCRYQSSSFAPAETSIPKRGVGFALWYPDSHFDAFAEPYQGWKSQSPELASSFGMRTELLPRTAEVCSR
ncbi:MAG TPA: hypothetical protein VFT65_11815 [Candidatus Angelobacter sp.]|nr:hypothetical protein [Candidatus Angelobacter sp.]